jgi:acyl dehydratase
MPTLEIENLKSLKQYEGREFPPTEWFVVSEDRIQKFSEVTEDFQWIHMDEERARRESPFGGAIAQGFLTLSLLSYFVKQAVKVQTGAAMTVNYGLNKVRFPSPVRSGSKVRACVTLLSAKESARFIDVVFLARVESQGADGQPSTKPCCVAEWLVRYYAR